MHDYLKEIIRKKMLVVDELKRSIDDDPFHPLLAQQVNTNPNRFKLAIRQEKLAVIAEIKRRSPSKGSLAAIDDSVSLAKTYAASHAASISVLTDSHFAGNLSDLKMVKAAVNIPVLRKDFIIDFIQIVESVAAGADAILLIVAILKNKTKLYVDFAKNLGLDVLVEVHDEGELEIALDSNADIIGINNRSLTTFTTNTGTAFQLKEKISASIITVAESGIMTPELAREYRKAAFDAVLIGEALVKSNNIKQFIEACHA